MVHEGCLSLAATASKRRTRFLKELPRPSHSWITSTALRRQLVWTLTAHFSTPLDDERRGNIQDRRTCSTAELQPEGQRTNGIHPAVSHAEAAAHAAAASRH